MKHHVVCYQESPNDSKQFEIAGFPNLMFVRSLTQFRQMCILCAMQYPDWYVVWASGSKVLRVYHGNRMWRGKMIPSELMAILCNTGNYNE